MPKCPPEKSGLVNDEREIYAIYWLPVDGRFCSDRIVGEDGVTKIEAYLEDGDTPWFRVWNGDFCEFRVNSAGIDCVRYRPKGDADAQG